MEQIERIGREVKMLKEQVEAIHGNVEIDKDGRVVSDKMSAAKQVKITVQDAPRFFESEAEDFGLALLIECNGEEECNELQAEIEEGWGEEASIEIDETNLLISSDDDDILEDIRGEFGGELVGVDWTEGYLDRGDEGSGPSGRRPKTKDGLIDRIPKPHINRIARMTESVLQEFIQMKQQTKSAMKKKE